MPIKLKRSSFAAKVPTTDQVDLGELALNTYDGKLYTQKDNGTASIVEIGAVTSVAGKSGAVTLVKGDVGLDNIDNTSDANKPVSTATQTALNAKVDTSRTVSASGLATGGGNLSANLTIDVAAATAAEYWQRPAKHQFGHVERQRNDFGVRGSPHIGLRHDAPSALFDHSTDQYDSHCRRDMERWCSSHAHRVLARHKCWFNRGWGFGSNRLFFGKSDLHEQCQRWRLYCLRSYFQHVSNWFYLDQRGEKLPSAGNLC